MKYIVMLLVLLPAQSWARDTMVIGALENQQVPGSCAVHNKNVQQNLGKQVTGFLKSFPEFTVIKTQDRARYVVSGAVRTIENCHSHDGDTAKVAVQLNVFDRHLNKWAFSYTSSVSATGPGVLNETVNLAARDVSFRVQRALAYRTAAAGD